MLAYFTIFLHENTDNIVYMLYLPPRSPHNVTLDLTV